MMSPTARIARDLRHAGDVLFSCRRSARVLGGIAPAAAVEQYVRECTRADASMHRAMFIVDLFGGATPFLLLQFGGTYRLTAEFIFIALWAWLGHRQCRAHIVSVHACMMLAALQALIEAAEKHHEVRL